MLARGRLAEAEATFEEDGFRDFDQTEAGTFEEQGHPEVTWKLEAIKPQLELGPDAVLKALTGVEGGVAGLLGLDAKGLGRARRWHGQRRRGCRWRPDQLAGRLADGGGGGGDDPAAADRAGRAAQVGPSRGAAHGGLEGRQDDRVLHAGDPPGGAHDGRAEEDGGARRPRVSRRQGHHRWANDADVPRLLAARGDDRHRHHRRDRRHGGRRLPAGRPRRLGGARAGRAVRRRPARADPAVARGLDGLPLRALRPQPLPRPPHPLQGRGGQAALHHHGPRPAGAGRQGVGPGGGRVPRRARPGERRGRALPAREGAPRRRAGSRRAQGPGRHPRQEALAPVLGPEAQGVGPRVVDPDPGEAATSCRPASASSWSSSWPTAGPRSSPRRRASPSRRRWSSDRDRVEPEASRRARRQSAEPPCWW